MLANESLRRNGEEITITQRCGHSNAGMHLSRYFKIMLQGWHTVPPLYRVTVPKQLLRSISSNNRGAAFGCFQFTNFGGEALGRKKNCHMPGIITVVLKLSNECRNPRPTQPFAKSAKKWVLCRNTFSYHPTYQKIIFRHGSYLFCIFFRWVG